MKRELIEPAHTQLSIARQCELLGLARPSYDYEPLEEHEENLALMRLLDEQSSRMPFYGTRKMTAWLQLQGYRVNRKRVTRVLRTMGLEALTPRPITSQPGEEHPTYPYLLRGMNIERINQVWNTDITYIRLRRGFVYLVVVLDWFSRSVLSWELSITLDSSFCLQALERALQVATPEIFNTDQEVQFTSHDFTRRLEVAHIRIIRDDRGRAFDNIFVERLWRTVKYEEVYLKDSDSVAQAAGNLKEYFVFYNQDQLHQALGYKTPAAVYHGE